MSEAVLNDSERPLLDTGCKQEQHAARVDLQFLRGFRDILRVIRPHAAALLSLLAILDLVIMAQIGRITGNYYRVLLDKDWGAFWRLTLASGALYAVATLTTSTLSWLSEYLAVRWRAILTATLQKQYMAGKAFYVLQSQMDNMDQRIVQDVAQFSSLTGQVAAKLAAAPFKVIFYSIWMGSITSWPALLAVYSFFVISTCIQGLIMSPIAGIVAMQERLEGNLRYVHMRVRMHAEQIAMWRGGATERMALHQQLDSAISNAQHLITWRWLLSAVTNALDYSGAVLNFVCVALPVASGRLSEVGDSGKTAQQISNASFATLSLIYSFTECLDLADKIASLAGLTARISLVQQASLAFSKEAKGDEAAKSQAGLPLNTSQGKPLLSLQQATCRINAHLTIVRGLDLRLSPGEHLMVTGPSGSGKSTLIRCLAGLGSFSANSEVMSSEVMFSPQRAITAPGGTLWEQLVYPSSLQPTPEELSVLLSTVHLGYLLQRVGGDWEKQHDWQGELSEGELQRICIARVLQKKPKLVFLDEPFSAVGEALGTELLKVLTDADITVFMTGQIDSPYVRYVRRRVMLSGDMDGSYRVEPP